jgi:hypothetical protein
MGINPAPVPDAEGNYHVRLGTVNELALTGELLQGDYETVDYCLKQLVGTEIGEYRFSRNITHLAYTKYNSLRQGNIVKPYYRLLSYTLTMEEEKIHIDGVIQPLDQRQMDWILRQNQGLIFAMRSYIVLQGYTKLLKGILSFDIEQRRYVEDKLLLGVLHGQG